MNKVVLVGDFNWNRYERITDRYGGIMLEKNDKWIRFSKLADLKKLIGSYVTITAKVLETRETAHIGDLALGISPTKPRIGTVVELGTGTLMPIETNDGVEQLVFRRDTRQDKETFWMDPKQLYRLHSQTVELTIQRA